MFWKERVSTAAANLGPTCLSHFYPLSVIIDAVTYPSAAQWMMAEKARLFAMRRP